MLLELDYRKDNGIEVSLFWDDSTSASSLGIVIALKDERTKLAEIFPVPAHCALDAFRHPFYYLPEAAVRASEGNYSAKV